jgi:hypothetical protein
LNDASDFKEPKKLNRHVTLKYGKNDEKRESGISLPSTIQELINPVSLIESNKNKSHQTIPWKDLSEIVGRSP